MYTSDNLRVTQAKSLHMSIKCLAEVLEIGQCRAKCQIRVLAVEEYTQDGLSSTSIVDYLSMKNLLGPC
jgi:hypothetical protein